MTYPYYPNYATSYGNIYPAYGGYGGCNHNIPLNYHSHGNLLTTAIGGLLTGDFSSYYYAPNPIYSSFPIGGYGLGYGGYGGFGGLGYGGYGGFGGFGYGGFGGLGYGGFGNVPYGGFFWGSRPNLPACTGHYNNYRSGKNTEVAEIVLPTLKRQESTLPVQGVAEPVKKPITPAVPRASLFRGAYF